jgi:hypothetical protein
MKLNYLLLALLVLTVVVFFVFKRYETFEDQTPDLSTLIANISENLKDNGEESEEGEEAEDHDSKKHSGKCKKSDMDRYCKLKGADNMPDMSKYVLKSSLPPDVECPACICPKIKVSSGLGCPVSKKKDCPPCPSNKPCNYEDCKKLVKCQDNEKPCPQDNKWCPACPKPSKEDLQCPPPQPCPVNKAVCPEVKCPEPAEPSKCEIINKNVVVNKDLVNIINDLSKELDSDPVARDKLLKARQLLKNLELIDPEDLAKENKKLKEKIRELLAHKGHHRHHGRHGRPGRDGGDWWRPGQEEEDSNEEEEENQRPVTTERPFDEGKDNGGVKPSTTMPSVTSESGKVMPTPSPTYSACPISNFRVNNNIN